MTPLLRNLLFALGLSIILWIGYVMFFSNDEALLTAEDALVTSQAARDTQEFLVRLQQLRNLNLDNTIFSDIRFQSLVDYRQEVLDEGVGRENPFAPIGQ